MTTPQPSPTDDLEAVARIIETRLRFVLDGGPEESVEIDYAREVADVILARLRPAGVGEAVNFERDGDKIIMPRIFSAELCVRLGWVAGYESASAGPNGKSFDKAFAEMDMAKALQAPATPPHPNAALMERVRVLLTDMLGGVKGARDRARALLSDLKAEAGS